MENIISLARPFYEDEGSHGWNHIQDVLERARKLKGANLTETETAAVVFHDCSLKTGPRETHAADSAVIARQVLQPVFDEKTLEGICYAIACHRASYHMTRKTPLADLVASADRNPPEKDSMLKRSYDYAIENGKSPQWAAQNAVDHVRDKYGRGGYAYETIPRLYLDRNAQALDQLWAELDAVTPEYVLTLVTA